MRIYVEQGQTALALKQYQLCCDALQSELGVRPEAETERLYQSIQENRGISRRTAGQPPALQAAAETRLPLDAIAPAHDLEAGPSTAKPSIAVLPFTNLSADPEQDYFADGIVEDIISGLTRLRWLFVIARDSSFIFKGKAIDVRQVGRELGVRYLLEGSVRRAGDRIRIASELLDSATGAHIWADHFDGALSDIFDLQDQITASVVGAIEPKLRHAEIERARRKPTESVDAYDLFLRAVALNATRRKEDNKEALRLLYRSSMAWSAADLSEAEEHVRRARELVVRQKAIVEDLDRDGHSTVGAENLLRSMQWTLRLFERDRDTIRRAL
jgi:TolB-like protein